MSSEQFEIRRIPCPKTREAFQREVVDAGVPVVLTDFCQGWSASAKWVPEYLAKNTEGKEGTVYISDRKAQVKGTYKEERMTIAQLLEQVEISFPRFKLLINNNLRWTIINEGAKGAINAIERSPPLGALVFLLRNCFY
jgi:hypothetical protein